LLALSYPHIVKQDDQPERLQRFPRVRVAQIVMDYLAYGWSVEEICRQHLYLKPAEAHAALGYYFDHQEELIRKSSRNGSMCRLASRKYLNPF